MDGELLMSADDVADAIANEAKKAARAAKREAKKLAKEAEEALKHAKPAPTPPGPGGGSLTPPSGPGGSPTQPSSALAAFFGPEFDGTKAFGEFKEQFVTFSQEDRAILTVTYPRGSSAPSSGKPGGAQICLPMVSGPAQSARLKYDLRIPRGAEAIKGGKLPGLYGGIEPFSGGAHNADGWSARLMWRGTAFRASLADWTSEVYGYISTSTGYGDDYIGGTFLADGLWHHVELDVHLNTPGNSDGTFTLFYDGVQSVSQTGLAITTTGTQIGGLFFSTFYGGHDSTWAPTSDQHLDFANFSIS